MARLERKNVDYFPHPCTNGDKMKYLRSKYGNDGYATWYVILEKLGRSEFHYIDLSQEMSLMFLADECLVDEKVLIEIIEILVKFGEFDSELWNDFKTIYCEKFVGNITDAWKNRKTDLPQKNLILTLLSQKYGKKSELLTEKHQKSGNQFTKETKGNKSKLNESKENDFEVIVYPSFDDFWNAYDKKIERAETEKKWLKLSQAEKEKVMSHVPRYVVATPNAQYRKNPTTYLNQKTYLDEIVIPQQNGNPKPTAADRQRESVIKAVNEIRAGVDIPRADDIFKLPPPVKNSQ